MERKEMIDKVAEAKAKRFLGGTPDKTGLLDFLKDGFTGLNELPEDQLKNLYNDLCNPEVTAPLVVELTPKDFSVVKPAQSVMVQPGFEIVAQNIMIILARTGNKFRELTWEEYKKERTKDNNFSDNEKQYFTGVVGYCKEIDSATLLSPAWTALKK